MAQYNIFGIRVSEKNWGCLHEWWRKKSFFQHFRPFSLRRMPVTFERKFFIMSYTQLEFKPVCLTHRSAMVWSIWQYGCGRRLVTHSVQKILWTIFPFMFIQHAWNCHRKEFLIDCRTFAALQTIGPAHHNAQTIKFMEYVKKKFDAKMK